MELHDPLFNLEDIIEKPYGAYEERVEAYWNHRYVLLEGGAFPTVSEMVWEG